MTSMTRRAILRLAALALPVAAVACVGGVDNPPIGQQLTYDSSGSTTTGGSGNNVAAVYKLSTFNGHTMPDTLVDCTLTQCSGGDTTREIIAILDSAYLWLDTTLAVQETDYFDLQDQRSAPTGPTFAFTRIDGQDTVICASGTYNDSVETDTVFQIQNLSCLTFGATWVRPSATYTFTGDSLITSTVFYQYFDSAATLGWAPYAAVSSETWDYFEAPVDQHGVSAPRGLRKGRRITIQSR
jgi:hypothetical protein